MYIHIGGEYSIPEKTILGIFDFDEVTHPNSVTNEYIKKAQDNNILENISLDLPKSIIVAIDRVYISPIATRTIKGRISNLKRGMKENG